MKSIKQKIFHIHPVEIGPLIWQRSGGNFTFGDLKRALIGPIADIIRMRVVHPVMSDLYADVLIDEKDKKNEMEAEDIDAMMGWQQNWTDG